MKFYLKSTTCKHQISVLQGHYNRKTTLKPQSLEKITSCVHNPRALSPTQRYKPSGALAEAQSASLPHQGAHPARDGVAQEALGSATRSVGQQCPKPQHSTFPHHRALFFQNHLLPSSPLSLPTTPRSLAQMGWGAGTGLAEHSGTAVPARLIQGSWFPLPKG